MLLTKRDSIYIFSTIKACMSVSHGNIISVTPETITTSTRKSTVVFNVDTRGIDEGNFKVRNGGRNRIYLERFKGPAVSSAVLPDEEWKFAKIPNHSHLDEIYKITGALIPANVAKMLEVTQRGKTAEIMYDKTIIISCGNVTVTIREDVSTIGLVTKNVVGIPDRIFRKVNSQIVRDKIAEKAALPPGPAVTTPEVRTVSKLINGIPEKLMAELKVGSEYSGLSVNQIILDLLHTYSIGSLEAATKTDGAKHNKLIPGIPKAHAKALKAHAAAEGISVNRLILQLLEDI